MSRVPYAFVSALAAVVLFAVFSYADDDLERRDLPPSVQKYFGMEYPFARITGITRSTKGGEEYFEIRSKDYGQKRTVVYESNGGIDQISETMPRGDLPLFVQQNIRQVYPHARISSVTKIYHWSNITFDVLVRTPGKEYRQLAVSFDGRILGTPI